VRCHDPVGIVRQIVTEDVADFVESALLTALTVTVWGLGTLFGAL
jgi:hypothetical protein